MYIVHQELQQNRLDGNLTGAVPRASGRRDGHVTYVEGIYYASILLLRGHVTYVEGIYYASILLLRGHVTRSLVKHWPISTAARGAY